jgi:hypothetical protein
MLLVEYDKQDQQGMAAFPTRPNRFFNEFLNAFFALNNYTLLKVFFFTNFKTVDI